MVTLDDFYNRIDDVNTLIKWWVIDRKISRYSLVMARYGSVEDFVSAVWLRIISSFQSRESLPHQLSTIVCNSCLWELCRTDRNARLNELNDDIRRARKLKPDDLVTTEDAGAELTLRRELDRLIAHLLRSLPFRTAVVLRSRLGLLGDDVKTLEEIGRVMKVTRERVRQLETYGIARSQEDTRRRILRDYDPNIPTR